MRSTFSGLELAKRALFTQQAALTTTGHNIANSNTRGYTRQVVNMVAARPIEAVGLQRSTAAGQLGQGVEFTSIDRIREKFLDTQYYEENTASGQWNVKQDTLDKLETIINEPSDTGIRTVIENFWNAWQELSKAPDNLTARSVVKESALAVTDAFNQTSKQLANLSSDLTENINVEVTGINTSLQEIATLNQEIYRIEGLGNNANDLRDQRDVLLDDLSNLINVSVVEESNGYNVKMGTIDLVQGNNVRSTVSADMLEQSAQDGGDLTGGKVYGMIYSRDSIVKQYQRQLDAMANSLAQGDVTVSLPAGTVVPDGTVINNVTYSGSVSGRTLSAATTITVKGFNGLHKMGYILNNGDAALGGDFFVTKDGSKEFTAGNLGISSTITSDVSKIAASMRTYVDPADNKEKVVQGNNDMALLVAALKDNKFNFDPAQTNQVVLSFGTPDEFFRAVVGQLGVQSSEAKRQALNQKVLVEQVDSRRQSVSGVSLDEEVANMIQFQHAYNAAARAMTTYDECLDRIINGMGIVGRG
jgi:flagellar hook-associated protein 1 FlgK